MKKPNWDELKTEYATTDIGYREMSAKYGIPMKTIADQGRKNDWVKARKRVRKKVATETVRKTVKKQSDHLAKIASSADKMADVIHKVMLDNNQFFRRIDSRTGEETITKKIDSKAIRELTAAMVDLANLIRNIYNIPTEADDLAMQIAKERLEIERKKAQQEEEFISNGGGIVLLPPLNEEEDESGHMETTT